MTASATPTISPLIFGISSRMPMRRTRLPPVSQPRRPAFDRDRDIQYSFYSPQPGSIPSRASGSIIEFHVSLSNGIFRWSDSAYFLLRRRRTIFVARADLPNRFHLDTNQRQL